MTDNQNDSCQQQMKPQNIQDVKQNLLQQPEIILQDKNFQQKNIQFLNQQYQNIKKQPAQIQNQSDQHNQHVFDENLDEELRNQQENLQQENSKNQNNLKNIIFNNQKISSCNCKKSKCLKMYCQCFAKGNSCKDTCKCFNCENTKNIIREKRPDGKPEQQIEKSEDSNKKSIKPKQKSCNCKKSFCLKKYCECYNANQACSQFCKCEDCKNNGDQNNFRNQKNGFIGVNLESPSFPFINGQNKIISEPVSEQINQRKDEQVFVRKRQKFDEQQIQTKISEILKLVPEQNYQNMLDFLALILS